MRSGGLVRVAYLALGILCIFAASSRSTDIVSQHSHHDNEYLMASYGAGAQQVSPWALRGLLSRAQGIWSRWMAATAKLFRRYPNTAHTVSAAAPSDAQQLTWAGVPCTPEEVQHIAELRALMAAYPAQSQWMRGAEDAELLRFLRAAGSGPAAWAMVQEHDRWRVSEYGAESVFIRSAYNNSPLAQEVFWLGNARGCPVLVIRSLAHEGVYFNDCPEIFTGRIVAALEEGRRLYGVGVRHQACLLLDRGGTVWRGSPSRRKIDRFDLSVVPGLLDLFRHLHSTLMANYPDLLYTAYVAPTSWLFSACYSMTSRVMSAQQRDKFQMISDLAHLHSVLDPALLPAHLGGRSESYQSDLRIDFDPAASFFPINASAVQRHLTDLELDDKG